MRAHWLVGGLRVKRQSTFRFLTFTVTLGSLLASRSLVAGPYSGRLEEDDFVSERSASRYSGRSDVGSQGYSSGRNSGLSQWLVHVQREKTEQSRMVEMALRNADNSSYRRSQQDRKGLESVLAAYDRENDEILLAATQRMHAGVDDALKKYVDALDAANTAMFGKAFTTSDPRMVGFANCIEKELDDVAIGSRKISEAFTELESYISGGDYYNPSALNTHLNNLTMDPSGVYKKCCSKVADPAIANCTEQADATLVANTALKKKLSDLVKAEGFPTVSKDLRTHGVAEAARIRQKNPNAFDRMMSTGRMSTERFYEEERNACFDSVMETQRKAHVLARGTQAGLYALNSLGCAFVSAKASTWGVENASLGYTIFQAETEIPLAEGRSFKFGCGEQMRAVQQADMKARDTILTGFDALKNGNAYMQVARNLPQMSMIIDSEAPVIAVPDGNGGRLGYMLPGRGFLGGLPPQSLVGNASVGSNLAVNAFTSGSNFGARGTASTGTVATTTTNSSSSSTGGRAVQALASVSDQGLALGSRLSLGARQQSAAIALNPRENEAQALATQTGLTKQTLNTMLANGSKQSPQDRRTMASGAAALGRNLGLTASTARTSASDVNAFYEKIAQGRNANVGFTDGNISDSKQENIAFYQAAQKAGEDWIARRTKYAQEADALRLQIQEAYEKKDTKIDEAKFAVADKGRPDMLKALIAATQASRADSREIGYLYSQWQARRSLISECNNKLAVLATMRPDTVDKSLVDKGSRAQELIWMPLEMINKLLKRFDPVPLANAAKSQIWGDYNSQEEWNKAWLKFVSDTKIEVGVKKQAAIDAAQKLRQGVENYKAAITETTIRDNNFENLVAMDMYLGTVQEETTELLERFRLQKDKAAISGNVMGLIRQSKDDATAAQNALGQVLKQRLASQPQSYMDDDELWWTYAQSVDLSLSNSPL